ISGKLTPLPKPSIDTGLGLERLISIIQDVPTNYDIDLILPVMNKVEDLSEKRIGESREGDVAMKVIADHSRASAFLIGDGVLPSNEGRGYVLRRIMRRAIRYGRNIGLTRSFLHETARVVFDIMKPEYPDLSEAAAFITNVIKNEEIRFSETLDHGLKILNDGLANLKAKGHTRVPGDLIFKLYDTFGFPVDIVQDVVRDEELLLDTDGFEKCMEAQRERSRSVAAFSEISDAYKNLSVAGVMPEFVGYDKISCDSKVLVLVENGQETRSAAEGQTVEVVVEVTPFYGEAGGQVGDTGRITGYDLDMEVLDTIKDPTGLIIHKGKIISGHIEKGENVTLAVDKSQRDATKCNHTATHILHFALRKILGDHVKQAGSLVAPDRLRFDFTHFSQTDPEALDKIETLVNQEIRKNTPVKIVEMDAEEAFKTDATAIFEEKYGDRVRVVSVNDISKELCGGTHTNMTGNIGLFKIIGESSVASGIRRIEALTGAAAVEYIQKDSKTLHESAKLLKENPEAVPGRIKKILSVQKTLEKEVEQLKSKIAMRSADWTEEDIKTINDIKVLAKKVTAGTPAELRDLADRFKEKIKTGIVVLGSSADSKALLIVVVTKDLTDRFHAGKIVKEVASVVGGGGGGRPDMAQAGGTRPENLDQALEKVYEVVGSRL
ncbi:MAG: alanine--tRNA ligase, partial [Desulfobacterales bacterium]